MICTPFQISACLVQVKWPSSLLSLSTRVSHSVCALRPSTPLFLYTLNRVSGQLTFHHSTVSLQGLIPSISRCHLDPLVENRLCRRIKPVLMVEWKHCGWHKSDPQAQSFREKSIFGCYKQRITEDAFPRCLITASVNISTVFHSTSDSK